MLTDRTERLPEALRMGWRPEPTPCPLALAGGLVTVFRAVIEALMRPMLRPRKHRLHGWDRAGQLIRDDYPWLRRLALHQAAREDFGRSLIASLLKDDVPYQPFSIYCSPEVSGSSVDARIHFVPVPMVPGMRPSSAGLRRKARPELETPPPDRLIRNHDPSQGEHFLHVAITDREPVVPGDGVADDRRRKAMATVPGRGRAHGHFLSRHPHHRWPAA